MGLYDDITPSALPTPGITTPGAGAPETGAIKPPESYAPAEQTSGIESSAQPAPTGSALPPAPRAPTVQEQQKGVGIYDDIKPKASGVYDDLKPGAAPADTDSQIVRGFKAGIDQMQGMAYGLVGVAGDAVGLEGLRDWGLEGYQSNVEQARSHKANVGDIREIGSVSEFGDWAAYQLGNLAPSMLTTIAGGGAGAMIGKKLAKEGIERLATTELKKQAARAAAKKGAAVGGVAVSAGTQTGGIYGQIYDETGEYRPGVAAAFGPLAGALEALPAITLINKWGLGDAAKKGIIESMVKDGTWKSVLARVSGHAGSQALQEGGTEAAQTVIERSAMKWVDENRDVFSKEGLWEIANAAAAGALGGAAMGAPGGLSSTPKPTTQEQESKLDLLNQQAAPGLEVTGEADAQIEEITALPITQGFPQAPPETLDLLQQQDPGIDVGTASAQEFLDAQLAQSTQPFPGAEGVDIETEFTPAQIAAGKGAGLTEEYYRNREQLLSDERLRTSQDIQVDSADEILGLPVSGISDEQTPEMQQALQDFRAGALARQEPRLRNLAQEESEIRQMDQLEADWMQAERDLQLPENVDNFPMLQQQLALAEERQALNLDETSTSAIEEQQEFSRADTDEASRNRMLGLEEEFKEAEQSLIAERSEGEPQPTAMEVAFSEAQVRQQSQQKPGIYDDIVLQGGAQTPTQGPQEIATQQVEGIPAEDATLKDAPAPTAGAEVPGEQDATIEEITAAPPPEGKPQAFKAPRGLTSKPIKALISSFNESLNDPVALNDVVRRSINLSTSSSRMMDIKRDIQSYGRERINEIYQREQGGARIGDNKFGLAVYERDDKSRWTVDALSGKVESLSQGEARQVGSQFNVRGETPKQGVKVDEQEDTAASAQRTQESISEVPQEVPTAAVPEATAVREPAETPGRVGTEDRATDGRSTRSEPELPGSVGTGKPDVPVPGPGKPAREKQDTIVDPAPVKQSKKAAADDIDSQLSAAPQKSSQPVSGKSTKDVTDVLIKKLGKTASTMFDTERLVVVQSVADLPDRLLMGDRRSKAISGMFDTTTGTTYMVADYVDDSPVGIFLHEVGVHYGLRGILGDSGFDKLNDQIGNMIKAGNKAVLDAVKQVPKDTPKMHIKEEVVAYLVEYNHELGIVKTLMAKIRKFLRKQGLVKGYTVSDIVLMAKGAARSVANGEVTPPTPPSKKEANKLAAKLAAVKKEIAEIKDRQAKRAQVIHRDVDSALSVFSGINEKIEEIKSRGSIKDSFNDMVEGGRKLVLPLMGRRQLNEVYAKELPQLSTYNHDMQRMDARRNDLMNVSAETAKEWMGLRKDRKSFDGLADVMHESTMWEIHPEDAYKPVINIPAAEQKIIVLRTGLFGSKDTEKDTINKQIDGLKERVAFENQRKLIAPSIKSKWAALPKDYKAMYERVRQSYQDRTNEFQKALLARIERSEMSEEQKSATQERIRVAFENAKQGEGPYFPLSRFGDYWVSAKKEGEEPVFMMFGGRGDQRVEANKMRNKGYEVKTGKNLNSLPSDSSAAPAFIKDVFEVIEKTTGETDPATLEMKQAIYQLYLRSLPDMSVRKAFIHRKKTAGFSTDAVRAFANNMFHGSHQLARVEWSDRLQNSMDNMRTAIREQKVPDANKATDVWNEMQKRHENSMNPKGKSWAAMASGVGFTWYLGMTPAAALVNVSQTPMVAYPVMASEFGWTKAGNALLKSSKDFIGGKMKIKDIENAKGKNVLSAIRQMIDEGVIDVTLAHDLAGMGSKDAGRYNAQWHRGMQIVSSMFHHAERFNRMTTFAAAYELAIGKGMTHEQAISKGRRMTYEGHFDYGFDNKPRFMQNDAAKILFMFKQFTQNMTYILGRNLHQSLKGESKEVRAIARRKLTGILGMHAIFAGTLGLPLTTMTFGILNAIFDDEDEPWDAETAYRNFLADNLGEGVGASIAKGPVSAVTGIDIASRTNIDLLDGMWIRQPSREMEGKAQAAYWLEQLAGPLFGIAGSFASGVSMANEGHVQRGIEKMTPKFIRDGIKMIRYADEGVTNMKGDPLIEETTPFEELTQGVGFTPSRVSERYDANNVVKSREKRIMGRRSRLLNMYALARRNGDEGMLSEAKDKIARFNAANKQVRITPKAIMQSLRARRRYATTAKDGINVNRRLSELRDLGRFTE